jgi:hypothetical protein
MLPLPLLLPLPLAAQRWKPLLHFAGQHCETKRVRVHLAFLYPFGFDLPGFWPPCFVHIGQEGLCRCPARQESEIELPTPQQSSVQQLPTQRDLAPGRR